MDKRTLRVSLLGSFLLLSSIITLAQDSEKKVTMKALPPAVQATVKEQSKGATIRGLAKEVEQGKTFYEAELMVNGHHKDVLMDPDGKVVAIEEQVALSALPAAVKTEMEKQAGKGKIVLVESVTKNDKLEYYEAHVKGGGKAREIKVGTDGKLMK